MVLNTDGLAELVTKRGAGSKERATQAEVGETCGIEQTAWLNLLKRGGGKEGEVDRQREGRRA